MNIGIQTLNKRIIVIALLIAVLAGSFWGGSRYPALDEKATMGGDTNLRTHSASRH
ncbi:hypothetical protein [Candidatus Reidiella endopervernicosa]|uniref:Uncharacterized protein n=1 Tax=Candidatus Reidiella endopervernicosa TaxID=2738883 RepID=A0A6N0HXW2_9GAMM|nr:hypothetical protein [Candidatus Reidiella endopervernicosa]QKQ27193.1 hypothetical protein HUE57_13505 [Candidatus Reidiella endopervernicosa]